MNYWQGDNICIRAMEESDADFFMRLCKIWIYKKMNQI